VSGAARAAAVVLAASVLGLVAVPARAATEIPVLTSPAGEFQPAVGDGVLAWEQNSKAQPRHYDVFARVEGGSTTRINAGRTNAANGGIDGPKLVYQQYRKDRSDIFIYDLVTGSRSRLPKRVNSRHWEYWPSLSGPWLLFARWNTRREVRLLYLHNMETGGRLRLDRTKGKNVFLGPGQINGNYAVWYKCAKACNVFRHDIAAGSTVQIANPGAHQRAPSVTAGGTVYFSRGGKGCGQSVTLVRDPISGPQEVLVALQNVLDIRDTYAYTAPNGTTEIYYERNGCGKPAASDIYKVREPALAPLTVTVEGNGTVVSSPAGINCGTDCSEDFETGTEVTLTAGASPGSVFVAWGGACSGSGACHITMDSAKEVTATFLPIGSVTIVKDAVPDDPQDFVFDPDAPLSPGFTLDDDPTSPLPNTKVISGASPGTYHIRELPVSGWQLTGISCVGDPEAMANLPDLRVTIDLDADEAVLCTFINTKHGSITTIVDALPDNGQDFSFSANSPLSPQTFVLDDDASGPLTNQRTFTGLLPSSYSVTQGADPPDWRLTGINCVGGGPNTFSAGRTATIGLDAGENVVCTFTNVKLGSITIVKDAIPDDPQDFVFDATGTPIQGTPFVLDDDPTDAMRPAATTLDGILPGVYTLRELMPSGWRLTGLNCDDADSAGTLATATATVVVSPDEDVLCTFTNTKQGSLRIVKDAIPDHPQDFTFARSPGPSFSLDDDPISPLSNERIFTDLDPRTYTVTETNIPVGWELTELTCSDPDGGSATDVVAATATVDLDPGELVTCTFVNSSF
jgi:hypothetical protein